jgi:hypothetical protein
MKESNLLPEDTHANLSAVSESKKAKKTRGTSGRKCIELLNRQDPLGSLLKTLLDTLPMDSIPYSTTWKPKATPQGRLLFQLALSERPTSETGYGWWRTPRASESTEPWPNVDARREKMRIAGDTQTGNLYGLTQEAQKADGVKAGALNPEFTGWLMGYPTGWTEIKPMETR